MLSSYDWLVHAFISTTFISNASWNWQKIEQMQTNILRLNFFYLKMIHILHPSYHPKIIRRILKNMQKNKCDRIHEIMQFIIMKIRMKMKNKPYKYDINRPSSRNENKYSKYKTYLTLKMLLICTEQLLSNTWKRIEKSIIYVKNRLLHRDLQFIVLTGMPYRDNNDKIIFCYNCIMLNNLMRRGNKYNGGVVEKIRVF